MYCICNFLYKSLYILTSPLEARRMNGGDILRAGAGPGEEIKQFTTVLFMLCVGVLVVRTVD